MNKARRKRIFDLYNQLEEVMTEEYNALKRMPKNIVVDMSDGEGVAAEYCALFEVMSQLEFIVCGMKKEKQDAL